MKFPAVLRHDRTQILPLLRTAACLACLGVLAGCATVTVKKVTDNNRNEVKGFRYYLPRPFLAVKKEMPLGGKDYLVPATMTANGQFTINEADVPKEIRASFGGSGNGNVSMSANTVAATDSAIDNALEALYDPNELAFIKATEKGGSGSGGGAGTGSGGGTGGTEPKTGDKPTTGDGDKPKDGDAPNSTPAPVSGQVNAGEYFDVLYMPDYSEQYAVEPVPGFGTSKLNLDLAHGWMLTKVGVDMDNTAAATLLTDTLKTAAGLAPAAATSGATPGKLDAALATAQKAVDLWNSFKGDKSKNLSTLGFTEGFLPEKLSATNSVNATLRIRVVQHAGVGLYKLRKPEELALESNKTAVSLADLILIPATYEKGGPSGSFIDRIDISLEGVTK